jgi:hypothetical protein
MVISSFLGLADGKFLNGVAWNKDSQFLHVTQEETKETLPYVDIATSHYPAGLRMLRNTDFQIVLHIFHPFPRAFFAALYLLALRRGES